MDAETTDLETKDLQIFKTATLEVLTKKVVHFDQLTYWQMTDANRRLLIDFF